ncbi:hypothetical protein ACIQBJ_29340 [Kitasatospora sp. NPDC088391]|uniref:hypothetical protein n=1 Tax=Kitasatospora sp. NPDC088391 TaxID=3364074 RepID=UPI0037F800AE
MDEQDEYRAATERTSHGAPTPKSVAVAYTVALLVLLVLVTLLIASGRGRGHPRPPAPTNSRFGGSEPVAEPGHHHPAAQPADRAAPTR